MLLALSMDHLHEIQRVDRIWSSWSLLRVPCLICGPFSRNRAVGFCPLNPYSKALCLIDGPSLQNAAGPIFSFWSLLNSPCLSHGSSPRSPEGPDLGFGHSVLVST